MNIDNEEIELIFREYFAKHIKKKNIAIDGKWLNGSDVNGQYTQQSHKAILNVLDKDTQIVFAQELPLEGISFLTILKRAKYLHLQSF
jgi:hypothetical protein